MRWTSLVRVRICRERSSSSTFCSSSSEPSATGDRQSPGAWRRRDSERSGRRSRGRSPRARRSSPSTVFPPSCPLRSLQHRGKFVGLLSRAPMPNRCHAMRRRCQHRSPALSRPSPHSCAPPAAVGILGRARGSRLAPSSAIVVMRPQVGRVHAAHTQRTELESLAKTVPEKQRASDRRARTAGGPDPESELEVSEAHRDRERLTSKESEPPQDRGRMVTLWVLASLIAEVEVLWWFFARMYTS